MGWEPETHSIAEGRLASCMLSRYCPRLACERSCTAMQGQCNASLVKRMYIR